MSTDPRGWTKPRPPARPLPFLLRRDEDETGISGTGDVAEGVLFTDGTVAIRWRGERTSTVVWSSLADVEAIHGHGGKTRIVWEEEDA